VARARRRFAAVVSLLAGAVAGAAAILSAFGAQTTTISQAKAAEATITTHSVAYGHSRISVQVRPGGLTCFRVLQGSSTVGRSCAMQLAPDQIEYASSPHAVGGIAGAEVRAVIVRLTRKGTVWATRRSSTFFAAVPKGYAVRSVVKVLRDGKRQTFTVTAPPRQP